MSGYVDTVLLDANRRQSLEFSNGSIDDTVNNADYTNKMGVGVQLNPGDRVSIHSGYVSRRGAGADTIELSGKPTGKKISLKQSKETNYQKMINPQDYFGLNIPAENYGQIAEVYGCEVIEEETNDYEIKDNEAYFNISYYKTTNGEGYFHLPRRFDALKNQYYDDSDLGPTIQPTWIGLFHPSYNEGTKCRYAKDWANVSGAIRPAFDCFAMGQCVGSNAPANYNPLTNITNYYKFAYSSQYRRCLADCHFYQEAQSSNFSLNAGGATGLGPSTPGSGAIHAPGQAQTSVFWKKKNDNSRYTLYEKEISYHSAREPRNWFAPNVRATDYNEDTGVEIPNNTPSRDDYASVDDTRIHLERRDPALSEYIKHVETKKIGVPAGNYSPGDLASLFTDQLNITQEPKYIVAATAYRGYPTAADPESGKPVAPIDYMGGSSDFNSKQTVISTVTEATTYKKFHAATSVSIEQKAWIDFTEGNSLDPEDESYHRGDEQTAINYLSAYKSIGVKRPELFDAGRKIMKELGYRYIGYNNADGVDLGDYSNIEEFVWADQKPPTTDTDTAGDLHGGELYEDNETNRNLGIANKRKGWSWKQMINPYVVERINFTDNDGVVITSWNWTQRNLDGLKEFFDIQGKYPELFEGIVLEDSPATNEATYKKGLTNKNARFLHMNKRDSTDIDGFTGTNNWKNKLGTDFMAYSDTVNQVEGQSDNRPDPTVGGATAGQLPYGSDALFFYFDETRNTVAQGGDTEENLYYGLFLKKTAINPYSGQTEEFIAITTEKIGGIPEYFFNKDNLDPTDTKFISGAGQNRTIGFDCHFSAYGTCCIGLYAGYLSGQLQNLQGEAGSSSFYPMSVSDPTGTSASLLYPIGVNTQDNRGLYYEQYSGTSNFSANIKPVHQYIKFRYVGAENPAIVFDNAESKFSFQQFHTPERVGNINNAGQTADNPIVDDTSEKVFFVNKRLLLREYCPDMYPYPELTKSNVDSNEASLTTYTSYFNYNITPYSIMDADCGIFIEDFGYDNLSELEWNLSLWGMLGFVYSQFHSNEKLLTRQTRINNTTEIVNIGKPTTNANVEPDDLQQLITNPFGAELRTTQLPVPMNDFQFTNATNSANFQHYPTATIAQKSAQINAEKLPVKTLKPYFLIKSDIISDTKFIGSYESGTSLPIIAVISKGDTEGDFFYGSGETEFTITNQKTISSVRTQILNPDGSLADVDENTSIIYKVVKNNPASLTVAQDLLQQTQQKQK